MQVARVQLQSEAHDSPRINYDRKSDVRSLLLKCETPVISEFKTVFFDLREKLPYEAKEMKEKAFAFHI